MRCLIDFPIKPEFQFIARAPWPCIYRNETVDWIESVEQIEVWLVNYVGPRYTQWVYAGVGNQSLELTVAFRWARDQGLFLLRWA